MNAHDDFSNMKGKKTPYINYLTQPITLRLDGETVAYVRSMSRKTGVSYHSLISPYLKDCVEHHRELNMKWGA